MKRRLLVYSGHCEIVGGDAKYLFDLLGGLDYGRFDVELFTDLNPEFERRARTFFTAPAPIRYLDTRPRLFPRSRVEEVYRWIEARKDRSWARPLHRVLSASWRGREVYRYLRRIAWRLTDWLTLEPVRAPVRNALIFHRLFASRKGRVDVFHFNNGGYPAKTAGLIAVVVARMHRIPVILMTCHSLAERRGGIGIVGRLVDRAVSRACSTVITASEAGRRGLLAERGFPPGRVTTIYCGLPDVPPPDPDALTAARTALDLSLEQPVLLMSGNLDWEGKGFEPLFQALVDVRRKHPDVRLLIAGGGQPGRERDLRRRVRELDLESTVRFLGFRTDIALLNAVADVCVVPSTGFEATPYTIKEAARAGRPSVTTTAGGCPEGVDDGVSGLLVAPGDATALAQAITRLLDDGDLRRRMGVAARELFLRRFHLADKIRAHQRIYLRMSQAAPRDLAMSGPSFVDTP